MDPHVLVDGVLRSVLGGRRKRSGRALRYLTRDLTRGVGHVARDVTRVAGGVNRGSGGFFTRPSTLLGALGLAWGIFETLQQNQPQAPGATTPPAPGPAGGASTVVPPVPGSETPATGVVVPPPLPNTIAAGAPAAVKADAMRMLRLAVSAAHADGPMNEQERAAILLQARQVGIESVFEPEMTQPRPLAEIVSGVTDPAERATLYVLAYTVLRADEHVTGAERIYLAQLANLLGLDEPTIAKLETDTGQRIDALGDQGQAGG
jgi:uncharacterized membrane protein YebE (DUF533 family)